MEEGSARRDRDEIFSNAVRAGKRTYFFDVKATRNNDLYLTITESKKKTNKDGSFHFEKHKLFLYKEDFTKFSDGLEEVIAKIGHLQETGGYEKANESDTAPKPIIEEKDAEESDFTDVKFEDLG